VSLTSVAPTGLGLAAGAALGSFAGAALVRWPRGATLMAPRRSRCDDCGRLLSLVELVPLASWLALRGRCRHCGARIDPLLPALEAGCMGMAMLAVRAASSGGAAVVLVAVACGAVLAAGHDLRHWTIPDRLTRPLALVGVGGAFALAALTGAQRPVLVLAWAAVPPILLEVTSRGAARRLGARPLGGGDVKLLVSLLAAVTLVPDGPLLLAVGALAPAGVTALAGLVTRRLGPADRVPFAPFLLLGLGFVLLRSGG